MSGDGAVATGPAPAVAPEAVPSTDADAAPETVAPTDADAGSVILWDNANIVESFPELTLPLTFSVAVELYAGVYRGACRALGVSRTTVEREARTFEQMLGLLQGHVYYNLDSWYRVLSLLPGFRLTAGFLEAMMGAPRPGSRPDERPAAALAAPARTRELAGMTVRLGYRFVRFESEATAFQRRIDRLVAEHRRPAPSTTPDTAGPAAQPDAGASPEALLAEFDQFRSAGLQDWRAPIMNDLFLMLTHGALRALAGRWLGAEAPGLVNELLVTGRVASAQPAAELLEIAAAIRSRPPWSSQVTGLSPAELWARLAADPELAELRSRIQAYIDAWGDRAPRELQLERPSYRDDPAALLAALRGLVTDPPTDTASRVATGRGAGLPSTDTQRAAADPRRAATYAWRRCRRRLLAHPAGPIRLAVFRLLLRTTRRHVRWREEMRLARGRVFGVGRQIFRELGAGLCERGVLGDPGDVHYLTIGELRGLIAGTAAPGDPRELVRLRRARYATYALLPPLPARLQTRGPTTDPLRVVGVPPTRPGGMPSDRDGLEWHGTGAAVGRVRAACLPVLDPVRAAPEPGRVIVARSTDPGWVPILVGAAGLAVEQGGLLSHSAIVARELGIPTVVGLPGLLDRVRDGDMLDLDGTTGIVRLEPAPAAAR